MTAERTGDVDQDFVAMMTPHHQGAIDIARAELKYGHTKHPTFALGPKTVLTAPNATSALPRSTDIVRPARLVRLVPAAQFCFRKLGWVTLF
jgi:hypothetical protein